MSLTLFCAASFLLVYLCAESSSQTGIGEIKSNLTAIWEAIHQLESSLQNYETKEQYKHILKIETQEDGFAYSLAFSTTEKVTDEYNVTRDVASAIYHYATEDTPKHWYKYRATTGLSFWHAGATLIFHCIHENGNYEQRRLGDPLVDKKAKFMVVIPPEVWYTLELDKTYGQYVLEVAVMIPGYEEQYWIQGDTQELKKLYPQHSQLLNRTEC